MIGAWLFPSKDGKRISDPNKPSKFKMKIAYTFTSISLALMAIAWVKMSLNNASEKETQIYFMVLVFLLSSLYNINKSIIWTIWDCEMLEPAAVPTIDLLKDKKEEDAVVRKGGAAKRTPKL